jgi:hypothetical protein
MTPAIVASAWHVTTRLIRERASCVAASISGASSRIVASRSRVAGKSASTNIA